MALGELHSAQADFAEVIKPGRAEGVSALARIHASFNLAICQYLLGDWDHGAAHAEQAVTETDLGGFYPHTGIVRAWAAIIAAGQGRWRTAREHLDASRHHIPLP
ncbi:hypothetical protein AB0D08_21260, partial [Kitasatospora sp. NPDC048540]|uniref:hypothetical protein n=1 Tax=Kitasatospora sp. NPDC048540 TaxID=3155634 RepID=UPI0033DF01A6